LFLLVVLFKYLVDSLQVFFKNALRKCTLKLRRGSSAEVFPLTAVQSRSVRVL